MIRALAATETVIDIIIAMKFILYRLKRSIDDIRDDLRLWNLIYR